MSDISITLDWTRLNDVTLGLSAQGKKLDLYFQPGLSWTKETTAGTTPEELAERSTQVITMLFLENDPKKGSDGEDFQRLATSMLLWTFSIAEMTETHEPTVEYYRAVYDAFVANPFDYEDFMAFLEKFFEFEIREPAEELNGTIFPMFPDLQLSLGKESGATPKVYDISQEKLQKKMGRLTAQFAHDFDFEEAAEDTEETARKFLFEDYGRLLVRTALQVIATGAEQTLEGKPYHEMIDAHVNYDDLAAIVSRFLLHGVRIPVSDGQLKPVYEATGQQFSLHAAKDTGDPPASGSKPDYTIVLSVTGNLKKLAKCFGAGSDTASDSLTYHLNLNESTLNPKYPLVAQIEGFKSFGAASHPLKFGGQAGSTAQITDLPFYRFQKRMYAMRKWISLSEGSNASFLLQVPSSLRQFLAATPNNPLISLHKIPAGAQELDLSTSLIDNNNYKWAVQIEMLVRQVPKTGGEGFLPGVLELAEISEEQINLLEAVILDKTERGSVLGQADIQVLCLSPGNKELAPLPESSQGYTLIRHNLATNGTIPVNAIMATATLPGAGETLDAADTGARNQNFLRMLWEGATMESGGYFLIAPMSSTAHDALFTSGDSLVLALLIRYDITDDPVFDFHNTVELKDTDAVALENNLLIAKVETGTSSDRNFEVPVPALPPGFVGFEFNTTEPQIGPVAGKLRTGVQPMETPSTSGQKAGDPLLKETAIDIFSLSRDGKWAFIRSGASKGWVPLKTTPPASSETPPTDIIAPAIPPTFNQDQALKELKSLYHLLGYRVAGDPLTKDLPIGPLDQGASWKYEKLIPAHAKLGGSAPAGWSSSAPPWEQNPYRGISASSQISVAYWWQDIYGNRMADDGVAKNFEVRYTDFLIGINQWPSLNEEYQFVRDTEGFWLELSLIFSQAAYAGLNADLDLKIAHLTSLLQQNMGTDDKERIRQQLDAQVRQKEAYIRRLKADLITYQKVYYQLRGPGVKVTVTTSLDDHWKHQIGVNGKDRNGNSLSSFVLEVYTYLVALDASLKDLENVPAYTGRPLSFRLGLSGLKPKKKFIQGLSCWLTMSREKELVHKDLKSDPKLKEISENRAVLSPRHEGVELTIQANQTLNSLTTAIMKAQEDRRKELNDPAPASLVQPEDIVLQHRSVAATVAGGIAIKIDTLTLAEGGTFGGKRQTLKQQEAPTVGHKDPVTDLVITKQDGLYETASRIVKSLPGDSFEALTDRIAQEMKKVLGPRYPVNFGLADLAVNFVTTRPFLQKDTTLTLEPLSIRGFAHNFTQAFPQFHIAVSEESNAGGGQANAEDGRPEFLFAVRLGADGIRYDIAEQDPDFYAIPPLATTLFSGKAMIYEEPKTKGGGEEKEVEGVDPNPLAREFLAALEEILSPDILAPAQQLEETKPWIENLLIQKHALAKKIAGTLAPILTEDNENTTRLETARDLISQRLLDNLVEGFDIESVVQYEATVTNDAALPSTAEEAVHPPRMTGKAKVLRVRTGEDPENRVPAEADDLDYNLTTGYFELDYSLTAEEVDDEIEEVDDEIKKKKTSFTYLFDTKTPEKFGNLEMEMEFQPLEMEFNLSGFPDKTAGFESSNKLRFILPANLNVYQISGDLAENVEKEFGTETAFKDKFQKILKDQVDRKFFSLSDFENAISKDLPDGTTSLNDPDLPYRKYCDALLSEANPNYMGRTAVPIPLRYYPMAPSLILQQAEADESSREEIRDLREWRYTIVYEHPEIAQDSIDCLIRLNVPDKEQAAGSAAAVSTPIPELVRLLLNFRENLPDMKAAIDPLRKGVSSGATEATNAKTALENFAFLTEQIATNWAVISSTAGDHYTTGDGNLHFEISEENLTFVDNTEEVETKQGIIFYRKALPEGSLIRLDKSFVEEDGVPSASELLERGIVKIGGGEDGDVYLKQLVPILALPGFQKDKDVDVNPEIDFDSLTFFFRKDQGDQTFFGDSSIPDRKFSIDNLDLLQQQNAWASIWLSRNKNLIFGKETNPAFIFRTPAVRFTNRLTPSIVNREPWDVATLPAGGAPSNRSLVNHLENMLDLFKPGVNTFKRGTHDRYELQIACRYAFAMARGSGLNEDLVTTLPILLGLRLTPGQLSAYPEMLSKEISTWFRAQSPVEENASLIFSVEAFSQLDQKANTSLPLLRVSNLELTLTNITNMPDIRTGNG